MNTELIERAIRMAHKPEDYVDFDPNLYVKESSDMIKELYQQMFRDDEYHMNEVGKWISNCNKLMEKLNEAK